MMLIAFAPPAPCHNNNVGFYGTSFGPGLLPWQEIAGISLNVGLNLCFLALFEWKKFSWPNETEWQRIIP